MCAASKNCKNLLKTSFWGVQGRSRSLMLINPKSLSPVLVMISSMYVPICNRFHIIRANNGKMTLGSCLWRPPAPASLNLGVGTWTAKIYVECWKFHTQVILVYRQPFRRNSVLKCALHPKIAKNSLKRFLRGSRSFKVIDVDKSQKPVTGACYYKQHVCTYLQPFSHYSSQ